MRMWFRIRNRIQRGWAHLHGGMMTCPRREEIGPWEREDGLDYWRRTYGNKKTCSFCGSLEPKTVLDSLESKECMITPTDKSYKAYVRGGKIKWGKFYFHHFDKEQQQRFIRLINEHKIKIGHPGYFYRAPYFMRVLPRMGTGG